MWDPESIVKGEFWIYNKWARAQGNKNGYKRKENGVYMKTWADVSFSHEVGQFPNQKQFHLSFYKSFSPAKEKGCRILGLIGEIIISNL